MEDKDHWQGIGDPPLSDDGILESICASILEPKTAELLHKETPLLYHIKANSVTQQALVKAGILTDCHEEV